MSITLLALLLALMPFLSFILLSFFSRKALPAGPVGTGLIALSVGAAAYLFMQIGPGNTYHITVPWFDLGEDQQFTVGIRVDVITTMMLMVVTVVSLLVHLFSIEYMKHEERYQQYFAYLGLFTFSMIGIVLSNNLLMLFIGWELVGFSSYLLIGFWYEKDAAAFAARKAFVINRIGDAGFLVAIFTIWSLFGTLDLAALAQKVQQQPELLSNNGFLFTLAGIGLFMACIGKSAQFPLQVWLPDAMEGPTPVSALIHAATMVAAGIYLLARVVFLLNPDVLIIIAVIGAATAFIGAFSALYQNDFKRVLAYSTVSQLGYMVMAVGVGGYQVALFHLLTHAFFKACLFLAAGAVIHSMHHLEHRLQQWGYQIHFDTQDMRLMGGLRKAMPVTFICYTLAMFSLAGLPLFSGFLSKDAILLAAWEWANAGGGLRYILPVLGFATALLTAYYMGRQWLLVFFGEFRLEQYLEKQVSFLHPEKVSKVSFENQPANFTNLLSQLHEVPMIMRVPLIILASLSLFIFFSFNPFDASHGWFISSLPSGTVSSPPTVHLYVGLFSIAMALCGLGLAYKFYGKQRVATIPEQGSFIRQLSLNSFYFDAIYKFVFVNFTLTLSALTLRIDRSYLDRFIELFVKTNVLLAHIVAWTDRALVDGLVNLMACLAGTIGKFTRTVKGGHVQDYLLWALLGIAGVMIWVLYGSSLTE
jgi:NADH-quinone oxidoreductase subunit L